MITRKEGGPGTSDPGRVRITNAELTMLVMYAYGIQEDQLKRPAWMDRVQFDVLAKVPPGTTAEQLRKMLQDLLAERFRLQLHHETQVREVYELTVAKNGPKLKRAAEGSGVDDFVPGAGPRPANRDNFPILSPGRPNVAQQVMLPNLVGRHVVDKTGLTGRYDFTLYFTQMSGQSPGPEENGPPIEAAVQQQLGLKLALSKASMDVLVIDNSEKTPTGN
jgi:uncharacterized protein (TIGR03435 family)